MMIAKVFKKSIILMFSLGMFFTLSPTGVYADAPYKSYTYNFWLEPVESPSPYLPELEVDGKALSIGDLKNPNDIFVTENGIVYVVDTENNRIISLTADLQFINEIKEFNGSDTFNLPRGIFVTDEGHVYVADTDNQRIIEFDEKHSFIRSIERPDTNLITDKTGFRPTKVVVDAAGRIYSLAIGINSGVIELNPDGTFQGFMGATEVSVNPLKYFWTRYLASDEQIKRMQLTIPTEYNNMFLDSEEFIYTTIGNLKPEDRGKDVIRRLNPTGANVLRDFGYGSPVGDHFARDADKITQFRDITVTDYHVYSALDTNNGKIFTYDYDGNLLYAFGSNGNRFGNFFNAVAIDQHKDKLFILDNRKNAIITFTLTAYGKTVNEALQAQYDGQYDVSEQKWEEVLSLNANSDIAYTGLGKIRLRNKQYQEAMEYFKLADNRKYYSKAFSYYRREYLGAHFGKIMTIVVTAALLIVIIRTLMKSKWFISKQRKERKNAPLF